MWQGEFETPWEWPRFRTFVIDDATWEQVQAIKARYSSHAGNKRQTKKRLLSGLVKCGCCSGSMTIINRERYYCSAKRERGTCESTVGIAAAELEGRVLDGLRDILLGQEELIEAFVTEFRAEVERLCKQRSTQERQSQRELNKVNTAIARCLKFITEGDDDPGLVRDQLRDLEGSKRELERALASSRVEAVIEPHPNLADLYRRKVAELQSLLTDEAARPEAMEIIRTMIERIEVHAGQKRSNADAVLAGALAQIIAFTQQKNNAASNNGGRVLMVAGARNRRYQQGLFQGAA